MYSGIARTQKNGPLSEAYSEAFWGILISACVYWGLLLLELLTLSVGLSVMYKKINAIQMLLHGLGVLGGVWMILDHWHWFDLFIMAIVFGALPFILEVGVILAARKWFMTINHIENLQKIEIERQKRLDRERVQRKAERMQ